MTPAVDAVRVGLAHATPEAPEPLVVDGHTDATALDGHRLLVQALDPAPGQPSGIERLEIVVDGWRIEVTVEPEARAALRDRARRDRAKAGSSGPTNVHAIIPGVVVAVSVTPGDEVTAGQQLLVVEAMKMQNELRAPRAGRVEQVAVGAGSRVEVGDLLLVLA